jgi:hypothetical protein
VPARQRRVRRQQSTLKPAQATRVARPPRRRARVAVRAGQAVRDGRPRARSGLFPGLRKAGVAWWTAVRRAFAVARKRPQHARRHLPKSTQNVHSVGSGNKGAAELSSPASSRRPQPPGRCVRRTVPRPAAGRTTSRARRARAGPACWGRPRAPRDADAPGPREGSEQRQHCQLISRGTCSVSASGSRRRRAGRSREKRWPARGLASSPGPTEACA